MLVFYWARKGPSDASWLVLDSRLVTISDLVHEIVIETLGVKDNLLLCTAH